MDRDRGPIALMAAVFLFLLAMPWTLVLFMLIYIQFGIVHFG